MSKQQKNYYRINIDSERGKALTEVMRQCRDAEIKADAWAANHHAVEYIEPVMSFAGGVSAVVFKEGYKPDPEAWKQVEGQPDIYEPNIPDNFNPDAARKRLSEGAQLTKGELLELSRLALPAMQIGHLFSVLPYKNDVAARINIRVSPLIYQRNSHWYVAMPVILKEDADITPISEKTFYRNRMSAINEQL